MEYQSAPPIGGRVLDFVNRWFDRAAPWIAAATVGVVSFALLQSDPLLDLPLAVEVLVSIACGAPALLARRRLWPLVTVAMLGWVAFILWPALVVASYYAGSTLQRRMQLGMYVAGAGIASAAAAVVSLAVGGSRAYQGYLPNSLLMLLIYVGLPLVVGLWVSARRRLLESLRERADRLEREQAARADRARSDERARIAREMHDVVAHRVSLIVLHAGALEVNATDERTAEAADLIRTTGREALAELRGVLGVLRSPAPSIGDELTPQPVLDDLDRLLEQSRSVGIDVLRRDEGEARPLPLTVERTAFRVVQEALTNVHKHAGAVRAEVLVRYLDDRLEVVVDNEPPRTGADPMPVSGFGLVGLTERVHLVGGELVAGARPDGGFTVRVMLPAAPAEEPVGEPA